MMPMYEATYRFLADTDEDALARAISRWPATNGKLVKVTREDSYMREIADEAAIDAEATT